MWRNDTMKIVQTGVMNLRYDKVVDGGNVAMICEGKNRNGISFVVSG
jgi:hypothetical protein